MARRSLSQINFTPFPAAISFHLDSRFLGTNGIVRSFRSFRILRSEASEFREPRKTSEMPPRSLFEIYFTSFPAAISFHLDSRFLGTNGIIRSFRSFRIFKSEASKFREVRKTHEYLLEIRSRLILRHFEGCDFVSLRICDSSGPTGSF